MRLIDTLSRNFEAGVETSAALVTFQVLTLPFGVFGAAASALGTVGYVGAVTGYSRGKEHEADKIGLDLMVQAGYHPQEATKLFEKLKEDLTFRKVDEPFFSAVTRGYRNV